MSPVARRAWLLASLLAVSGGGVALLLANFRDNIVFFMSPGEFHARPPGPGQRVRVGGLVVPGSVVRDGLATRFVITDGEGELEISYRGLLPDLFREGQGIVAGGVSGGEGALVADQVLAKHDERYMPPEIARALRERGQWRDGETTNDR